MAPTTWEDIRSALARRTPSGVGEAVSRHAAVALVLREGAGGIEILFIRRAEHPEDPWSGQMAFPGGRAEPGETHLKATAVRETVEEIGVDLESAGECLGGLDEVRAMARLRPMDLAIAPFVFRLLRPAEMTLNGEVRSVHWLPLDALMGPEARSTMEYPAGDATLVLPCLRFEGLLIWGLTYRMFTSLETAVQLRAEPADPPHAGETAR